MTSTDARTTERTFTRMDESTAEQWQTIAVETATNQPRVADRVLGLLRSLADITALIEQAQTAREDDGRPPLRVLAVLNLADPGANQDNADAVAALGRFPQLTALDAPVRRRKAVANAMAHGLSVTEITPRDLKAVEEIAVLCNQVFDGKEQ